MTACKNWSQTVWEFGSSDVAKWYKIFQLNYTFTFCSLNFYDRWTTKTCYSSVLKSCVYSISMLALILIFMFVKYNLQLMCQYWTMTLSAQAHINNMTHAFNIHVENSSTKWGKQACTLPNTKTLIYIYIYDEEKQQQHFNIKLQSSKNKITIYFQEKEWIKNYIYICI